MSEYSIGEEIKCSDLKDLIDTLRKLNKIGYVVICVDYENRLLKIVGRNRGGE